MIEAKIEGIQGEAFHFSAGSGTSARFGGGTFALIGRQRLWTGVCLPNLFFPYDYVAWQSRPGLEDLRFILSRSRLGSLDHE